MKVIEIPSDWGGANRNQGRSRVADKKRQVYIGIKESVIKKLGGDDEVKNIMLKAVDEAAASTPSQ